ncbi:MAG TPA: methionyl-tRNA formyltransferase [Patescibacteria group bacterium]|nr:methionyl-tRNA formyltransferase [Patescibacteria group bacterium]
MRVVFFGTPKPAAFALRAIAAKHTVLAVVTSPDKPVGRKQVVTHSDVSNTANELGILTLKPEKVKGNEEFLSELRKLQADIFIVVSYGKILSLEVIYLPRFKSLNIHYSLLPKYRGASPIQASLLAGDTETGITIFELEAGLDTGPIYSQIRLPIESNDTYITLESKLTEISVNSLLELLPNIEAGKATKKTQDNTQASFCKIIEKSDGAINWKKTALEIYNMYRAYIVWPGIFTTTNGSIIKITKCELSPGTTDKEPGTLLTGGVVACGQGSILQLLEVVPAGKRAMDIGAFLNGNSHLIGSKFSNPQM